MNNYLKEYPTFQNCKKLREMSLNSNQIESIDGVHPDETPQLRVLDLGSNNIFVSLDQWGIFVQILKQFTNLYQLNLEDNPFFAPENEEQFFQSGITMKEDILKEMYGLSSLNGLGRDEIEEQINNRANLMREAI